MKFVLTGFSQSENIRNYLFQGIGDDPRTRTDFNVGVDLTLVHKHGIPLQEVPLLCCFLLASHAGDDQCPSFMISEGDLRTRAEQRATERTESQTKPKSRPAPPLEPPASLPQAPPDFEYGKLGIGLGSRAAHHPSPSLQGITKR